MKKPFLYLKKMSDFLHSILKELDPGTYHIKYVLDGHEDIEFDITVVGGVPKTYHKSLVIIPTKPEGKTDLAKSTIPTTIYLETEAPFAIFTENTGIVKAKYQVTILFSGVDVDKKYEFESEFSGEIEPGKNTMVVIPVFIPLDAIPKDKVEATYDISTILVAM